MVHFCSIATLLAFSANLIQKFQFFTTYEKVDFEKVIRDAVAQIGFDDEKKGLDYKTCRVLQEIHAQSPQIAAGVHEGRAADDVGAGDQGIMFGYATNESETLMPLTHALATQLGHRLTVVRKEGILPWVRPDGKPQVTMEYPKRGQLSPGFNSSNGTLEFGRLINLSF